MQDPTKQAVLARRAAAPHDDAPDPDVRTRCPVPSRCPYCAADVPVHWIRWGSYERYAGDPDDASRRVAVPRYQCKFTERTFSLLPDDLLPYCSVRTPRVLSSLRALFVGKGEGTSPVPLSTLARSVSIPRGTLRRLKRRFLRTVPLLRLPPRAGPLSPATFLAVLLGDGTSLEEAPGSVLEVFRAWKEREPKHSIVGIYAR
jgi:hypothetical protein